MQPGVVGAVGGAHVVATTTAPLASTTSPIVSSRPSHCAFHPAHAVKVGPSLAGPPRYVAHCSCPAGPGSPPGGCDGSMRAANASVPPSYEGPTVPAVADGGNPPASVTPATVTTPLGSISSAQMRSSPVPPK